MMAPVPYLPDDAQAGEFLFDGRGDARERDIVREGTAAEFFGATARLFRAGFADFLRALRGVREDLHVVAVPHFHHAAGHGEERFHSVFPQADFPRGERPEVRRVVRENANLTLRRRQGNSFHVLARNPAFRGDDFNGQLRHDPPYVGAPARASATTSSMPPFM